jgi:ketosteroid isomerase-like protein
MGDDVSEDDVDAFLTQYHQALDEFARGNHEPARDLWSGRDDITLGNPFGPFVSGMTQVEDAMRRAASNYRDGRAIGFDEIARCVVGDLAFVAEVEHLESKIGDDDQLSVVGLRVTSVLRREDGRWRLVHRHADPITSPRTAESVLGER